MESVATLDKYMRNYSKASTAENDARKKEDRAIKFSTGKGSTTEKLQHKFLKFSKAMDSATRGVIAIAKQINTGDDFTKAEIDSLRNSLEKLGIYALRASGRYNQLVHKKKKPLKIKEKLKVKLCTILNIQEKQSTVKKSFHDIANIDLSGGDDSNEIQPEEEIEPVQKQQEVSPVPENMEKFMNQETSSMGSNVSSSKDDEPITPENIKKYIDSQLAQEGGSLIEEESNQDILENINQGEAASAIDNGFNSPESESTIPDFSVGDTSQFGLNSESIGTFQPTGVDAISKEEKNEIVDSVLKKGGFNNIPTTDALLSQLVGSAKSNENTSRIAVSVPPATRLPNSEDMSNIESTIQKSTDVFSLTTLKDTLKKLENIKKEAKDAEGGLSQYQDEYQQASTLVNNKKKEYETTKQQALLFQQNANALIESLSKHIEYTQTQQHEIQRLIAGKQAEATNYEKNIEELKAMINDDITTIENDSVNAQQFK